MKPRMRDYNVLEVGPINAQKGDDFTRVDCGAFSM